MASTSSRYGYQKLTKLEGNWFQDEGGNNFKQEKVIIRQRSSNFMRFRRFQFKRRLKLRIPRLFLTRKARLLRAAWKKVVKRLKENQGHFGDLFAGNYLFMQVSPSSLKIAHNKSLPNNNCHDLSCRQMAPYY